MSSLLFYKHAFQGNKETNIPGGDTLQTFIPGGDDYYSLEEYFVITVLFNFDVG